MKRFCKHTALLLALLMVFATLASAMVACQPGQNDGADTTAPETEGTTTPSTPDGKVNHVFTVKTAGGMPLKDVNVYIYTNAQKDDLVNFTTTDATGTATIALAPSADYVAVLSGLPTGYITEEHYPVSAAGTAITVTSKVIEGTDHAARTYKLGDVMNDFEVVDTNGNTQKLSELLKTKKMVLINFWYSECSPCISEFPYMNSAYEQYKNDIEIVALSHYNKDTEEVIKLFRAEHELTFPMARDTTNMAPAFNITAYPTSIVVDRYGVICLVEEGAIVSESPFTAIFSHFTAENYEQKLVTALEDIAPKEKPNVTMPSTEELSQVFDGGKLTVTYTPEADDEYSWPFIITEKNGAACLANSNKGKHNTYAILYANVEMKKGDALAFDYWASCEQGADTLVMLVDRKDIYRISGEDSKWNTCYTYVAIEDGTYEVAFCYIKDAADTVGDDAVYVKNLRTVASSAIDVPTYIPRYAATHPAADGFGYEQYITPVFNEADGYYHVGEKNGPLLLAGLLNSTRFSNTSIYSHALAGQIVLDGKDYLDEITPYASYASNATISSLCPVNEELKLLLEKVAAAIGMENDNPNQWLQICSYYDVYATGGKQLENPIMGLCPDTAFVAVEGDGNSVTYDRMLMPRGLLYKFTPAKSGAYRITSKSDQVVEGWIFSEDMTEYYVHEGGERLYYDPTNISMVVYFEAGVNYYIDICYYDVYAMGTFTFSVDYLGATYNHFTQASPGYFTFPDGGEAGDSLGDLAEILAGGIDVVLGDDGYYHEKRADGTLGSVVYADFIGANNIFGDDSLISLIDKGAFNFALSEGDEIIHGFMESYGDKAKEELRKYWGEEFDYYAELYSLDEVLAGKTHGTGKDLTADIKAYLDKLAPASETTPELEGTVPVDKRLAEILQILMDKYTFNGVEHSWTKLSYYYQYLGQ